jgi:hypothetical protein
VASGGPAGCPWTPTITPTTPQVTIQQQQQHQGGAFGGPGGARTGMFNPYGG